MHNTRPYFTVCCLFYGNYPALMERLLTSLARPEWAGWFELRLGWSDLSPASAAVFLRMLEEHFPTPPLTVSVAGAPPYHKYPVMREMFRRKPLTTPCVMWFDDDSYIKPDAPRDWFEQVAVKMDKADMIGAPYTLPLVGGQREFIQEQPWYAGKVLRPNHKIAFVTGGWWAIETAILTRHDWPPPCFQHNGGDVMLGALCHQQGYRIAKFTGDLGINCNASGTCSSAPRRGCSQAPIGRHYIPGQPLPASQQQPPPKSIQEILGGN